METRSVQGTFRGCPTCGGRKYAIDRQGDRAIARVCSCSTTCSHCQGTGFVYTSREETFSQKVGPKRYDVVAPCPCKVLRARTRRFNEAGLPGVLSQASFDSYMPQKQEQARAKEMAMAFAHRYPQTRGYLLSGPVGTGKSHLIAATLTHAIIEVGVTARYVEISLLYATIRRGFQEGKSGGEIIGPLSEVELLAIDELGKGRGSPFEMETLDELIARRYNAGRVTLFATNYSLRPPEQKGASGYTSTEDLKGASRESLLLCERVGERIYSRLCEMCQFIEFPAQTPDHRRTRQELDAAPVRPARR